MPTHNIWNGNVASIKLKTSDNAVFDVFSIYKVYNGATGAAAYTAFLTNENASFPADKDGAVSNMSVATTVKAFQGATPKTPTITTITSSDSAVTATK